MPLHRQAHALQHIDPAKALVAPKPVTFDTASLRSLADLITNTLGIRMPDVKLSMLQGRLQRRLHELGVESLEEYMRLLNDPKECVAFLDLATTNKTDFFREAEHFEHLTAVTLPALSRERRGAAWTCRVWCAGCSTGEEAYTLAMVLSEYASAHPGFDFEIWATDVSVRVLQKAASATYSDTLIAPIPAALRNRYLLRGTGAEAGRVRIVRPLRSKIRFARLNFMDPEYSVPHHFDVVFFRNVLIYFDRTTQRDVVKRQCQYMNKNGYLYISHSESLSGLDLPIEALGNSVFRRTP